MVGTDEPFTLFKTKFAVSNRILVKLGEISFSTYMLHQILIGWYLSHDPGLPWYVDAVILLEAAYLGSWAMFEWWENPMRRYIINRGMKLRTA